MKEDEMVQTQWGQTVKGVWALSGGQQGAQARE